ncbi:MAG: restriction endonuclease subunit S [Bdellovibrionota bacterium]
MRFSEWREVKVSEIGKVVTGKTPKTAISENYGGNIPFLTPSDDMNIKKVKSTARTLSEMGLNSVKNCLLPAKSICVSCIGSDLGKVVLTSEPTVTNQQINSIVPDENFDPDFIYYRMTILGKHLNYLSKTSTAVPIINKTTFSNFSIIVPSIEEQKAIAHILSTLDEKIEVNNQINKTLENMAQAIFKQWFVDFEFPNEDGEPYKSSGGEMIESELGMIPKGWEVKRIGDECICSLGGTPSRQKSDYWNGDIPWVNSGEVNNFRIYKPSEYITKLGLEKSATKLLKKKTTVLAITGATLGQVSLLEIDTCTNQSVVGISENDKISHVYIYPYVKSVIEKIIGNQTGGAQQHINKRNVEDTKLLIPNKKVLNTYTILVRPQYDLISSICFENELLTRLRDSLLPKLMSGEIRVPLDEDGDAS